MIVETDEFGFWIGFGHENRGSAEAAAHVGNACSALQFRVNTAQSRNPAGDQVGGVARTEEAFGAYKKFVMMFVPTQTFSSLESFGQLLLGFRGRQGALKRPRQKDRTAFIRHRKGLFFAHAKLAGRRG